MRSLTSMPSCAISYRLTDYRAPRTGALTPSCYPTIVQYDLGICTIARLCSQSPQPLVAISRSLQSRAGALPRQRDRLALRYPRQRQRHLLGRRPAGRHHRHRLPRHRPDGGGAARSKCRLGSAPSSAPSVPPPLGTPDGSGQLGTRRKRSAHCASRHCLTAARASRLQSRRFTPPLTGRRSPRRALAPSLGPARRPRPSPSYPPSRTPCECYFGEVTMIKSRAG